jgi:hypothetical protein
VPGGLVIVADTRRTKPFELQRLRDSIVASHFRPSLATGQPRWSIPFGCERIRLNVCSVLPTSALHNGEISNMPNPQAPLYRQPVQE